MNISLSDLRKLIVARRHDPAAAVAMEHSIAASFLTPAVERRDEDVRPLTYAKYSYLTPYAATEAFGLEVAKSMRHTARELGMKPPRGERYVPGFTSIAISRELWKARQVVDECEAPYDFYMDRACAIWLQNDDRMPRISQLVSPDIAIQVMAQWADPWFRIRYPIFEDWDDRFKAKNYRAEPEQERALRLLDQRIEDAKSLGNDPAHVFMAHLDQDIRRDLAIDRYGETFVKETDMAFLAEVRRLTMHGGVESSEDEEDSTDRSGRTVH